MGGSGFNGRGNSVSGPYRYQLAITSQFPFCGIPFRLDSYSTCQFACRYCFASARGGASGSLQINLADPSQLRRRLERIAVREPRSALDEMLNAQVPIHFGGMSDPFMPMELEQRVSLALLQVLAEHQYPVIISTKGNLVERDEYVEVLQRGRFVVQFSFSSSRDRYACALEPGTPSPSARLRALGTLAEAGIATAIRIQPFLPKHETDAGDLMEAAAKAGARHASVEHLKLPVERDWSHREKMNSAVGYNLAQYYRNRSAQRVGREWILPALERLPAIVTLRAHSKRLGMNFGAADNDFLHWSDGVVCCSGADLLGMGEGLQFNFTTAIRRGLLTRTIEFDAIRSEWRPTRSISEFVNSRSRRKNGETVESYIKDRWNGVANGPSPSSFFGVQPTGEKDADGFQIYALAEEGVPEWISSGDPTEILDPAKNSLDGVAVNSFEAPC